MHALLRFLHDARHLGLAAGIQFLELARELFCFLRVLGREQAERELGRAHARSRIDARRDRKSDVVLGRIMQLQTRRARERTQSRPLRLTQHTQAPVHERAILIDHRHHVGDGGDRDEVQEPLLPTIWYRDETLRPAFLAFSHECLCNLECDPCTREPREGISLLLRIDDDALGQRLRDVVMVGDDHIDTERSGVRHRFHCRRAHVHRDDECHSARVQLVDRVRMKPVSFFVAMRDIDLERAVPQLVEHLMQERRARDAVAVEVAIHGDALPLLHREEYPRHGAIHVGHQKGVVRIAFVVGGQETFRRLVPHYAPLLQQCLHER